MIIAGLTGGIASGKSTVSGFLADLGAHIIDADKIAREVVEPGMPAYQEIVSHFGPAVARTDGAIDRKRLGDVVFNDPRQRKWLEAIVHPRVHRRSAEMIAAVSARAPDAVIIRDIPLLFETGVDADLSEIIVVYVPEPLQLQRLMARDGIDAAAALARIRSQMPIEEKRRRATFVIDNSGSLARSREQTRRVFDRLKRRSANAAP